MKKDEPIRVLIFSEHAVFLEGLGEILRQDPGITIVRQARNLSEAVFTALHRHPDVVLLDIVRTDSTILEAIRLMKEEYRQIRIFILCISGRLNSISRCLRAGASGYLPAKIRPEELLQVIRGASLPHLGRQPRPLSPRLRLGKHEVGKPRPRIMRFPNRRSI